MLRKTILALVAVILLTSGHEMAAAGEPRFTGLFQTYNSFGLQSSRLTEMTLTGPDFSTLVPLDRALSDIAIDPTRTTYYGNRHQDVYRVDSLTGVTTDMNVEAVHPEFEGWPVGITFDTTRDRVVLASLVGVGALFAYSPASGQWSTITSTLNNVDLQSLAYRPANDTLYGFPNPQGSPLNKLYRYGPAGNFLGVLNLSQVIPEGFGSGDSDYQLMLTSDDRLALLTAPVIQSDPTSTRLYIIDPNTGQITYNQPFPLPEPASAMVFAIAGAAIVLERRRRS